MRKIISIIISAASIITISPMSVKAVNGFRPNGRLKLDINADEHINAVDASIVLSEYAKSATGEGEFTRTEKFVADFNDDGKIDAVDASGILSVYAQNSSRDCKEYPITTLEFYSMIKVGHDWIACGNSFLSYEEAMTALECGKENLEEKRQTYSECNIQMVSTIMTDLPQTEIKYVYREVR